MSLLQKTSLFGVRRDNRRLLTAARVRSHKLEQRIARGLEYSIFAMGLFGRKSSKVSADNDSVTSTSTRNFTNPLKSPASSKITSNGHLSMSLPDVTLPRPPDPNLDPAAYLRSIYAVRERTSYIFDKARRNQLAHFDVDMTKFRETATYTVSIIKASLVSFPGSLHFTNPGDRETMRLTIIQYPRMDGGSTLR